MRRLMVVIVGLLAALYLLARFVPVEPLDRRPGLGLIGPELDSKSTDWSFISGLKEIEVETQAPIGIPYSVTTVIWRDGDGLYVPCKACATKRWPRNVEARPHVRLKIDGLVYPMQVERISDQSERDRLLRAVFPEVSQDVWVFRMKPA